MSLAALWWYKNHPYCIQTQVVASLSGSSTRAEVSLIANFSTTVARIAILIIRSYWA